MTIKKKNVPTHAGNIGFTSQTELNLKRIKKWENGKYKNYQPQNKRKKIINYNKDND